MRVRGLIPNKVFSPFTFHFSRKRYAFTLAEVLITLGIIGVVAAITMPMLITHYQKLSTVNQLKKAYSEFSQAVKMAEIDHGLMETWNFKDFDTSLDRTTYFGENYLFPYIKTVEKCIPSSSKCWADEIKNVSGNNITEYVTNSANTRVSFITASGYSGFYWLNGSGLGMWYWVDINGPKKGPNRLGRDIFAFETWWGPQAVGQFSSSAIVNGLSRDDIKTNGCSSKNSASYISRQDGMYCGALIMLDGWKIEKDYPW